MSDADVFDDAGADWGTREGAAPLTQSSELRLSTSGMRDYLRCPRLYQIRRTHQPAHEAEELRVGTLVHAGLEAWHLFYAKHGVGVVGHLCAVGDAVLAVQDEQDEYIRTLCEVLLIGYDAMWGGEKDYAVEGAEIEFRLPLSNGAIFDGRVDAVVRVGGMRYIVEHKTTRSEIHSGAAYWNNLKLDAQVSNYSLWGASGGAEFAGIIYDVIRKPDIRPMKDGASALIKRRRDARSDAKGPEGAAEYRARLIETIIAAPELYYQRRIVVRLQAELAEAEQDLIDVSELIRLGRFPRSPGACGWFKDRCAFYPVCVRQTTLDNERLYKRRENNA